MLELLSNVLFVATVATHLKCVHAFCLGRLLRFFRNSIPHSAHRAPSGSLGSPHAGHDPYASICARDSSLSLARVVADMFKAADNSGMSFTYARDTSRRNATRRAIGVSLDGRPEGAIKL